MPAETEALFFKVYEKQEEMWLPTLFSPSKEIRAAGRAYLARMMAREDRDEPVAPLGRRGRHARLPLAEVLPGVHERRPEPLGKSADD